MRRHFGGRSVDEDYRAGYDASVAGSGSATSNRIGGFQPLAGKSWSEM